MNFLDKIFYELAALDYKLGQQLHSRFTDIPWIEIDSHNSIPEVRANPNSAFPKIKKTPYNWYTKNASLCRKS